MSTVILQNVEWVYVLTNQSLYISHSHIPHSALNTRTVYRPMDATNNQNRYKIQNALLNKSAHHATCSMLKTFEGNKRKTSRIQATESITFIFSIESKMMNSWHRWHSITFVYAICMAKCYRLPEWFRLVYLLLSVFLFTGYVHC